jgi:hypothetical protein
MSAKTNIPASSVKTQYNNFIDILKIDPMASAITMKALNGTKVLIMDKRYKYLLNYDLFLLGHIEWFNPDYTLWNIIVDGNKFRISSNRDGRQLGMRDDIGNMDLAIDPPREPSRAFMQQFTITPRFNSTDETKNGFKITCAGTTMIPGGEATDTVKTLYSNPLILSAVYEQYWDIILMEPDNVCRAMPDYLAGNVPTCRAISDLPYVNRIMSSYCVMPKTGSTSNLISQQSCRDWCTSNPANCEATMLSFCKKYPNATECKCIYANKQPDYLAFKKQYPLISGSASCFTKECSGGNLINQLIPISIQNRRCPDLTNIDQSSQQTLNVATGATVINPTMNTTQNATATNTTQNATSATNSGSSGTNGDTAQTNYLMMFIILIWFIVGGYLMFINLEDSPAETVATEAITATDV